MKRTSVLALVLVSSIVFISGTAQAATFFVQDTLRDSSVSSNDARAASALVRDAVATRPGDSVVQDEYRASYVLQPRLIRVGQNLILTVEKIRGRETLFAAQARMASIDELDQAAYTATKSAIEEPAKAPANANRPTTALAYDPSAPYDSDQDRHLNGSASGATSSAGDSGQNSGQAEPYVAPRSPVTGSVQRTPPAAALAPAAPAAPAPAPAPTANRTAARGVDAMPATSAPQGDQWMVGFGPFLSRSLSSDVAMYNGMIGHKWNLNTRAAIKAQGEMTFSSGRDRAQVYNVAAGGNYYLPGNDDTALYFTGDMGYGVAKDAEGNTGEGFSLGTGAGVEFFRTTQTTLDLLLRYSVIFDNTKPGAGNPTILGARMAVNF
jgi:hypothetical protein